MQVPGKGCPPTTMAENYAHIVSSICRDKESGWSINYYKPGPTSFDVPLARAHAGIQYERVVAKDAAVRAELNACEKGFVDVNPEKKLKLANMRTHLETLKGELQAASDVSVRNKKKEEIVESRALIAKTLKDMESERDVHIHKLRASLEVFRKEMKQLAGLMGTLTYRSWEEMADHMLMGQTKEANRRTQLQKLRNAFMRDGNMAALKEGVVACMQRFA